MGLVEWKEQRSKIKVRGFPEEQLEGGGQRGKGVVEAEGWGCSVKRGRSWRPGCERKALGGKGLQTTFCSKIGMWLVTSLSYIRIAGNKPDFRVNGR